MIDPGEVAGLYFVRPEIACVIARKLQAAGLPCAWNPRAPRGRHRGCFVYYLRMNAERVRLGIRAHCPDEVLTGEGEPLWQRMKPIEHRWDPDFWEDLNLLEIA